MLLVQQKKRMIPLDQQQISVRNQYMIYSFACTNQENDKVNMLIAI